jgi:hypothetical protein
MGRAVDECSCHGQGPAGEVKGKARKKTRNDGRVIFGEPGRQQLHHRFRDHELQVLGSRKTRVTRIGFRETSRWSEAWEARHVDNDWKPDSDRMPRPCDFSSTSLLAVTSWISVDTSFLAPRGCRQLERSRSPR